MPWTEFGRRLTMDEVLDLIAYLKSGGDPQAAVYE